MFHTDKIQLYICCPYTVMKLNVVVTIIILKVISKLPNSLYTSECKQS